MITCRSLPHSNIVEMTIDGDLSRGDFDAVLACVTGTIEDYGSVNLLEEIRSIGKVPPSVVWDDLTWLVRHMKHIARAAVVCDEDWVERLVRLMQPLVSADVRSFALDEIDEAREWLRDSLD